MIITFSILNCLCYSISSCPCCLKVETSCHSINIKYLTCKVEIRNCLAFEGVLVNSVKAYASAGDKLVLEGTTPCNLIPVVEENVNQAVDVLLTQFTPAALLAEFRYEIVPKALLESVWSVRR